MMPLLCREVFIVSGINLKVNISKCSPGRYFILGLLGIINAYMSGKQLRKSIKGI